MSTAASIDTSVLCVSFTHMFDSHAFKKPSHGLFYSVFQRRRKKILKPDLDSPDNILQGSSGYQELPLDLETQTMIF